MIKVLPEQRDDTQDGGDAPVSLEVVLVAEPGGVVGGGQMVVAGMLALYTATDAIIDRNEDSVDDNVDGSGTMDTYTVYHRTEGGSQATVYVQNI